MNLRKIIREILNESFENEIMVFHGGNIESSKDYEEGFPIYVSPSRSQAREYAKGNEGRVNGYVLDKNKIASEEKAREVIKKLGINPISSEWTVDDSSLYELIDDRFEQHINKKDVDRLFNDLEKLGYEGVEFMDADIKTGNKYINNMVIFNPKKTLYRGNF